MAKKFEFQMDDSGNHRIVVRDDKDRPIAVGKWASYESISNVKHGMDTYIAFTAYYDSIGRMVSETVYGIVKGLPAISRISRAVAGRRPEDPDAPSADDLSETEGGEGHGTE